MKQVKHILILMYLVALVSCVKKKYPETNVENEPVFYFRGTADNTPVNITAGISDYYMYTSYHKSAAGLNVFSGQLRPLGCTGCGSVLELGITDYRKSEAGIANSIDSALRVRDYNYAIGETINSQTVTFQSSYVNQVSPVFRWDFGDGTTSSEKDPIHVYSKPGRYNVSLQVTGQNGCVTNVRNTYNISAGSLIAGITAANSASTTIIFSAEATGQAPFVYLWDFGDGTYSGAASVTHVYPHEGSYPVRLRVVDARNDTAIVNYNAVTLRDKSSCAVNSYVRSVAGGVSLPFSTVDLVWTDAQGIKYGTAGVIQPAGTYFRATEVSDYGVNENGDPLKKLKISLRCALTNGTRILTIDGTGVICLAYPR